MVTYRVDLPTSLLTSSVWACLGLPDCSKGETYQAEWIDSLKCIIFIL